MTNKEAIKRIQDIIIYTGLTIPTSLNDVEALKMAIKALEEEERSQGKWIKKVDDVGFISHICSECGAEIELEDPCDNKFCFNCGAPMGGKNGLSLQKNDRNS